ARLSGSAILCALMGCDDPAWLPGDLDYIVDETAPLNPSTMVSQWSGNAMWITTNNYAHISRGMILQVLNVEPRVGPTKQYCKVQTIMVRSETPEAFVRECFDLPFLRN